MKLKFFFLFFCTFFSYTLFAYPISPMPLRKLIMKSENIVYAEVIDIKINKNAKDNDWFKSKIAVLKLYDVLQGNIKNTQTIEVYTSEGFSCPAPAHYEKGSFTLAFIYKEKEDNRYSTHSLSYGSKEMNKDQYSVYKNRIVEMQEILKIKNEEEKHTKTVDWLVECALNDATKWEGTYELSPESDFMSFYDQNQETFIRKFELNDTQKQKLRTAFFSQKNLNYHDLGLIDIITKPNDKELLDFLVLRFKQSYKDFLFECDFFMSRIADLSNREDLKQILQKNKNIDMFDENYDKKTKETVNEFVAKL